MTTISNRPKHTTFVPLTTAEREGFKPLPLTPQIKGYWVYWREPSGRMLSFQPYRYYVSTANAANRDEAVFYARRELHLSAVSDIRVVQVYA